MLGMPGGAWCLDKELARVHALLFAPLIFFPTTSKKGPHRRSVSKHHNLKQ